MKIQFLILFCAGIAISLVVADAGEDFKIGKFELNQLENTTD